MFGSPERQRILVVTDNGKEIDQLFSHHTLAHWDLVKADKSSTAAIILQNDPGEIVLIDESFFKEEGMEGIDFLAGQQSRPLVFLADLNPNAIADAYAKGICLWLPRELSLKYPRLLAEALRQTQQWRELQRRYVETEESLSTCHRQKDQLLSLMLKSASLVLEKRWYTHRHLLERLNEEIARSQRHGTPLTVALGEIRNKENQSAKEEELVDLAVEEINRSKRRCDVAGLYGMNNFMLLMTHTPEQGGVTCCRRLQSNLENRALMNLPSGPYKAFFGLATFSPQENSPQSMLRNAEQRLEAAKQGLNEGLVAG